MIEDAVVALIRAAATRYLVLAPLLDEADGFRAPSEVVVAAMAVAYRGARTPLFSSVRGWWGRTPPTTW